VQLSALSHARLMRESSDRVASALHSDDQKEHLIAQRILESPASYHSWELEHSALMRHVADVGAPRTQNITLRQTALRLIHAKALFEYLRKFSVRGEDRARIVEHFYPTRVYDFAMVQEHSTYMRKACSFLCTSHLGSGVVQDETFIEPLLHYEQLYAEYFDLYCSTLFPHEGSEEAGSERELLPLLKHQLNEWRWVIMNPFAGRGKVRRERELRRPLGDTQRMPVLRLRRN
jgi:hypothetical protein